MTVKELKAWLEFQDENLDVVLECDGYDILRHIDQVSNRLRYTIWMGPLDEMHKGSPFHRGEPDNDLCVVLVYHL